MDHKEAQQNPVQYMFYETYPVCTVGNDLISICHLTIPSSTVAPGSVSWCPTQSEVCPQGSLKQLWWEAQAEVEQWDMLHHTCC